MKAIPNRPRGKGLQKALRGHLAAVIVIAHIVYAGFDNQAEILQAKRPDSILTHAVPESLDSITYSQRLDLQDIKTESDMLFKPCEILFSMTKNDVLSVSVFSIIGLSMWVIKELNRMSDRERTTLEYKPEPEELKAGINELRFGAFGIIDSIVRTRPVYTHEAVLQLSCAKVYAMQLIDHKQRMYEKRLRKEYSK